MHLRQKGCKNTGTACRYRIYSLFFRTAAAATAARAALMRSIFSAVAVWIAADTAALTQPVASASNNQPPPLYKCCRDFFPRALVNLCHGCTGDVHLARTLFVRSLFQIHQPDDFKFIHRHGNLAFAGWIVRRKAIVCRFAADSALSLRSWHRYSSISTYADYIVLFLSCQANGVDLPRMICYNPCKNTSQWEDSA